MFFFLPATAQEEKDSDLLGKAIEYFQSSKYHEALLLFEKLEQRHRLNPRFRAYMGLCYFHDWQFDRSSEVLREVIPSLGLFAPHEREVYYYSCAESFFFLQKYRDAVPYYENALSVSYDNEKGDIFYRIGMCYMFTEEWQNAIDFLESSRSYYRRFRQTDELKARLTQIQQMISGCEKKLADGSAAKETEPTVAPR
ncbi:MAG: hypothetical protein PUK16_06985 [Prevotellaceae bacterium]|nr:hypothetical protein [Prevotellaceae bacterium]